MACEKERERERDVRLNKVVSNSVGQYSEQQCGAGQG